MLHVHPIAHLMAQVGPFLRIFHHIRAALTVIFLDGNRLAYILLRDAQFFFHSQFHGKAMGIPAGLALHQEAFHSLETTERILDRTCQDMVDTRMPVG